MRDLFSANASTGNHDFQHTPSDSISSFENAIEKARDGDRLLVDDAVELLTTGTDIDGVDEERKREVLELADRRRAEEVGSEVSFVANINNNVTTACNVGCLFCNFKDAAYKFESRYKESHNGFTKTPEESHAIVSDARERGVYEVCSVSGLHPSFTLDQEHREILETRGEELNYRPAEEYDTDPGTYTEQISAMKVGGVHVHSITPEEAYHAKRGTDWSYQDVYSRLSSAGLDTVPGTAAEILVDEVREVICPGKIDSKGWMEAMTGAADAGLGLTATIMYGHVENEMHRAMHLGMVRELQDRTNAVTEFVPLSFIHANTPLYEQDGVKGASRAEDELMIAVSRLFLDNIPNIQSSWVKYGDELGLRMLDIGANDFMGTILSEEITKRAGGEYGEYRSFKDYVEMITSIDREPVERSTDYSERRIIDPEDPPFGPMLGPAADGTPMV